MIKLRISKESGGKHGQKEIKNTDIKKMDFHDPRISPHAIRWLIVRGAIVCKFDGVLQNLWWLGEYPHSYPRVEITAQNPDSIVH